MRCKFLYLNFTLLTFCIVAIPVAASADMIWPGLYLTARMYDFRWAWVVILGFFAEWPFYHRVINQGWKKSLLACTLANGVTTAIGCVLIPLSSLFLDMPFDYILGKVFNLGTFSKIGWCLDLFCAALGNTLVEATVTRLAFKIPFTKKMFLLLLIANTISVGMVGITLYHNLPKID